MNLSQEFLHTEIARRIHSVRPDLHLSTISDLRAAQSEIAAETADTMVVSVVRQFDLESWIRNTVAFAMSLEPEAIAEWRASFTRTIFLAGNPGHLQDRFAFEHVSEDGSVAWTAPSRAGAHASLRRLLKLFDATGELRMRSPVVVALPGARRPVRRVLYVATAGVTISSALVHLNHLLAEAVFDGHILPGDQLVVHQVPRLIGVPAQFEALRVGVDSVNPERLRAYAGLTQEIMDA